MINAQAIWRSCKSIVVKVIEPGCKPRFSKISQKKIVKEYEESVN